MYISEVSLFAASYIGYGFSWYIPFQSLVFFLLSKITSPPEWIIDWGTDRYVFEGIVTCLTSKYLQHKNKAFVQLSTETT